MSVRKTLRIKEPYLLLTKFALGGLPGLDPSTNKTSFFLWSRPVRDLRSLGAGLQLMAHSSHNILGSENQF